VDPVLHTCDYRANDAGKSLHRYLGSESIILYGDINRTISDLNRSESRHTKFRRFLSQLIQKTEVEWVLDAHSFPPQGTDMKGEIVFLSLSKESYLKDLVDHLRQHNIDANMKMGSYLNDIILEAKQHHLKYLLLEYNEDLTVSRLNYISQLIARYVKK
jgi:hypothetical protein